MSNQVIDWWWKSEIAVAANLSNKIMRYAESGLVMRFARGDNRACQLAEHWNGIL